MKKYFFAAIFIFFNFTIYSQTVPDPPVIDFFQYSDFEPMYKWSNIRIWGWSKDGKAAYSNNKFIDGRGGVITTVIILNLKTDAVLYRNSLDSIDFEDFDDYEERYNNAYRNFIANYRNICTQNGIEFIQTDFKNLPIKHNARTVNIIIEKIEKTGTREEWEIERYGKIGSYKVIAKNQRRQKIIHENTFRNAAFDVIVCGYFISPFEDRALVIVGEYVGVFEGKDVEYVLIGCHLSDGFR
jgi:hypothetical protein